MCFFLNLNSFLTKQTSYLLYLAFSNKKTMKKFTLLTICLLGLVSFNFSQYYYIPASTPGNPGGLNTDSEYPNGSGLPAGWSVILGPSNSSPTWSTVEFC